MFEMYVRTPLVFFHFLFAAYALVTMIALDVRTLRFLKKPLSQSYMDHAKTAQVTGGLFLGMLYVTGFTFVIIGAKADGGYLSNENLYFKMAVVFALTINGFVAHFLLKDLDTGDIIDRKHWMYGVGLRVVPVISICSWLWAAFSGVARSWNFNMPIEHILGLYLLTTSIAVGLVVLFTGAFQYGKEIALKHIKPTQEGESGPVR